MVPSHNNHVARTLFYMHVDMRSYKADKNCCCESEKCFEIAHVKLLGWDNFDASFINHVLI